MNTVNEYSHAFEKNEFDVGEIPCEPSKIVLTSQLTILSRPHGASPKDGIK